MSTRKGNILLPIIAVIGVIAIVAAGYFFWQSIKTYTFPDENNLETYTNDRLSYSIQYPKDCSLRDEYPYQEEGVEQVNIDCSDTTGFIKHDDLRVVIFTNRVALDHYPDYRENYKVAEIPAYRDFETNLKSVDHHWAFFHKGDDYYDISLFGGEKYAGFFTQILSTFRFLDTKNPSSGQFCGGIAGIPCPTNLHCQLDGNYPDAGGKCIAN